MIKAKKTRRFSELLGAGLTALQLMSATPVYAKDFPQELGPPGGKQISLIEPSLPEITPKYYPPKNKVELKYNYTTTWWEYPLNITSGLFATVYLHESGHCLTRYASGDDNIRIYFKEGYSPTVSSTPSHSLSRLEKTFEALSGMALTTAGNLTLEYLLTHDLVPESLQSGVATTSLLMLLDRHRYTWSSALVNFTRLNHTRSSDMVHIINNNLSPQKYIDLAYGAAVAASALELYLRRDEISFLLDTAVGKQVEIPKDVGIKAGLYSTSGGLTLALEWKW